MDTRRDTPAGEGGIPRRAGFPDTRWSLVSDVRNADTEFRDRALAELCRIYWFPLYAFARAKGCDPSLAEDLTQDLFLKLIARDSFEAARPERGRLRNYLLTAMNRTMANDARRRSAAKRRAEHGALSIERDAAEERLAATVVAPGTNPEEEFDRRWIEAVLAEVERRLGREYDAKGSATTFEKLQPFLLPGGDPGSYDGVATELGMSVGAVKVAVFRMRKRFRSLLRAEIAETVNGDESVDDELRHLLQVLARTSR